MGNNQTRSDLTLQRMIEGIENVRERLRKRSYRSVDRNTEHRSVLIRIRSWKRPFYTKQYPAVSVGFW